MQRIKGVRDVVITGGIGTGKSTVCKGLEALGVCILDADTLAHQILQAHHRDIARLFGEVCVEEGVVNRTKLGAIVFADPKARQRLEAFVHPKVHAGLMEAFLACKAQKKLCVLDIPLYYETRSVYEGFCVAVVYAPKALQLARVCARNGWDEETAMLRINAQLDIEQKRQWADYVIDNSQDLPHLEREIAAFYRWLKEEDAFG